MNCVTWAEAYAFCIWDKGFLPSAAELEYAAAGGPLQYEYPWGEADPGTGDGFAIYDTNGTLAGLTYPGTIGTVTGIAPVGTATLGVGPFGQLDLAGEVWEWALDWTAAYTEPCVNCATTTGGGTRARHGGSFSAGPSSLQVSYFSGAPPTERTPVNGFRCARAP